MDSVDNKVDVITLFDVIEHVENPLKLLENAYEHLNEDGMLLVYTPNHKSLEFEVLGTNNTQYFPSDHLFIMSSDTVRYLASRIDTRLSLLETKGTDIFDILAYDRDINGMEINTSILKKDVNVIQNYINIANYANHMRFIFKRWK